ncbi:uncharacterized protein LOC141628622 [Silene latifolia]|uniref:uncharacterized protein LOC141628622 n=1 Tax=Silene latifolia TaxID=37657 RepID=UPI003D7841A0
MAILYTQSAKEIWKLLKGRYLVSNGARKYKLNKDTYEMKQNGKSITEYYIQLWTVWDELENLNDFPIITVLTEEISAFLDAMQKRKEEARLFQFLNGLDATYGTQRSAVLLMSPLPTVDDVVSIMVQEEAQQQNIQSGGKPEVEASALMGKGEQNDSECKHCGLTSHTSEKCWFGPGNQKPRRGGFSPGRGQGNWRGGRGSFRGRGRNFFAYGNSHNNNGGSSGYGNGHNSSGGYSQQSNYQFTGNNNRRMANITQSEPSNAEIAAALASTTQQLESLLKYVPGNRTGSKCGHDTDEEIDCNYAGILSCYNVNLSKGEWIVDSGESDHMITDLSKLHNVRPLVRKPKINLPNGEISRVTHMGDMNLKNGLKLVGVMYVPDFKQNLMYVQKLCRDNNCLVKFYNSHCIVQDCSTLDVKGSGKAVGGLYYLETHKNATNPDVNKLSKNSFYLLSNCDPKADNLCQKPLKPFRNTCNDNISSMNAKISQFSVSHNRLGHAPYSKL